MNGAAMEMSDRISELVIGALRELDSSDCLLSSVTNKAARIARLLDDYDDLWWLLYEMIPHHDRESAKQQLYREIRPRYSNHDYEARRQQIVDIYLKGRRVPRPVEHCESVNAEGLCVMSIGEMEDEIQRLQSPTVVETLLSANTARVATADMIDLAAETRVRLNQLVDLFVPILACIRYRVYSYLSMVEKRLLEQRLVSSIFERNRAYVDGRLKPDALEQLHEAPSRATEGSPEARSHALLSCRRALKSIADELYGPVDAPVQRSDGKERELTDEKYVNRLWQFVSDRIGAHKTGQLLLAQIGDLGNRVDAVYGLSNKGTHAEVSEFEANQCVIQTYLVIGDILRLAEGDSTIGAETEEEGK